MVWPSNCDSVSAPFSKPGAVFTNPPITTDGLGCPAPPFVSVHDTVYCVPLTAPNDVATMTSVPPMFQEAADLNAWLDAGRIVTGKEAAEAVLEPESPEIETSESSGTSVLNLSVAVSVLAARANGLSCAIRRSVSEGSTIYLPAQPRPRVRK